jgi:hypothetical protein
VCCATENHYGNALRALSISAAVTFAVPLPKKPLTKLELEIVKQRKPGQHHCGPGKPFGGAFAPRCVVFSRGLPQ